MTHRYQLDEDAIVELNRFADWYDRQAMDLGARFVDEVFRVLDLVATFPEAYVTVRGTVRKATLSRFPFFVVFEVLEDEFVVLAVMHQAQHPARVVPGVGPTRTCPESINF